MDAQISELFFFFFLKAEFEQKHARTTTKKEMHRKKALEIDAVKGLSDPLNRLCSNQMEKKQQQQQRQLNSIKLWIIQAVNESRNTNCKRVSTLFFCAFPHRSIRCSIAHF